MFSSILVKRITMIFCFLPSIHRTGGYVAVLSHIPYYIVQGISTALLSWSAFSSNFPLQFLCPEDIYEFKSQAKDWKGDEKRRQRRAFWRSTFNKWDGRERVNSNHKSAYIASIFPWDPEIFFWIFCIHSCLLSQALKMMTSAKWIKGKMLLFISRKKGREKANNYISEGE